MSRKHPIIVVTGSSGAGTSTVKATFDAIFRREGIKAAVIEGDAFHRYNRTEMKAKMAQAEQALAGKAFVRIHRSMLVNRARITGLDRCERPRHLRLTDGSLVRIGEAYRANLG